MRLARLVVYVLIFGFLLFDFFPHSLAHILFVFMLSFQHF